MEDINGDYKDKTVTLEDFPFLADSIKMASVHPCKHASVMKTLLDRADAALKIRRDKHRKNPQGGKQDLGMEGLVDDFGKTGLGSDKTAFAEGAKAGGNGADEWEVLQHDVGTEEEVAIRVDQYLVVFLKVSSSQSNPLLVNY